MNVMNLFCLENWVIGNDYHPMKKIYKLKDNFIFVPLFDKETIKNRENFLLNKGKKFQTKFFDTFKPEVISGWHITQLECSKFFIILNRKLYLLDNKSVHIVMETTDKKYEPNGDHKYDKEESLDLIRRILYNDAKLSLEKVDYVKTNGQITKMYYGAGENINWFDIKDKFLEEGLYWGIFKTYFLIRCLKIQISLHKIKNKNRV